MPVRTPSEDRELFMQNVAVIGAGPGGLAAARYLKSEGLEPVLFEQGERIGGQWSADPGHSGVWPAMRTNTSRIMTAFSDLPHDANSPTYPTNEAMGEYLQRYAEQFDLIRHIRFKTPVVMRIVVGSCAQTPAKRVSRKLSLPPADITNRRFPMCLD